MGSLIACGIRTNDHASLEIKVPTALPMHMRKRIREIVALRTEPEHRGNGHARDLLQRVCTSADLTDTWLMLCVEPSDDTTDTARLFAFYERFGFVPFQAEPLLMIRKALP